MLLTRVLLEILQLRGLIIMFSSGNAGLWRARVTLAVLIGFSSLMYWSGSGQPGMEVAMAPVFREYIAQTGPSRPFLLRLSGPWEYAAYRPGTTSRVDVRRKIELEDRIRRLAEEHPTLAHRWAQAQLLLLNGRVEEAVGSYRQLLGEFGPHSALFNDLAVGLHAQAETQRRFSAYLEAISALEQASRQDSVEPSVHFNRVLLLGQLHLSQPAADAAERYLDSNDASDWRHEVRQRQAGAKRVGMEPDDWAERFSLAAASPDAQTLAAAVQASPFYARRYVVEHVLEQWAESPEVRLAALETAERTASLIFDFNQDPLLQRAVARIRKATFRDVERLAHAHQSYAQAVRRLWAEGGSVEVCEALCQAGLEFQSLDSPMALWAQAEEAVCRSRLEQYQEVISQLSGVIESSQGESYYGLRGRAYWIRGLALLRTGRTLPGLADFRRALADFQSQRDSQQVAAMYRLLAGAVRLFNDTESAWDFQLRAWTTAATSGDGLRRLWNLLDIVAAAFEEHRPLAARPFQQQAGFLASAMGLNWNQVQAHRWGAAILDELGDRRAALAELQLAFKAAALLTDPVQRQTQRAALALTEADIGVGREDRLSRALEHLAGLKHQTGVAEVRLRLARLWRSQHEAERALEELYGAIESAERRYDGLLEAERAASAGSAHRARLAEQRGHLLPALLELYDEALDILKDRKAESGAALALAERARVRAFASSPGRRGADRNAARVLEHIPPDATIIVCTLLDSRLAVWALNRAGVEAAVSQRLSEDALELLALPERDALGEVSSSARLKRAAGELFDLLLRPLQGHLQSRLVFVPGPKLAGVPFGLLWDRDRQRYLIEDREVATAPTLARAAAALRASDRIRLDTALCVGDPAFDRGLFPAIGRLPEAAGEARLACSRISGSEVLVGPQASASRVMQRLDSVSSLFFAGHAVPFGSGAALLMAPGAGQDDGALTSTDFDGLDLKRLDLAYLSACRAGSDATTSPLGPLGIAQAFLRQGTPFVVASVWPIGDRDSSAVLVDFLDSLNRGRGVFSAFQEAQTQAVSRHQGQGLPAWAGLQLFVSQEAESW